MLLDTHVKLIRRKSGERLKAPMIFSLRLMKLLHLVVVFNKEVQLLLLRRREAVYRQLVENSL